MQISQESDLLQLVQTVYAHICTHIQIHTTLYVYIYTHIIYTHTYIYILLYKPEILGGW